MTIGDKSAAGRVANSAARAGTAKIATEASKSGHTEQSARSEAGGAAPASSFDNVRESSISRAELMTVLERDPKTTPSDPLGSAEVTRVQSETANAFTGSTTPLGTDKTDHLVADPIETEQRSDLEFNEAFEPGSKVPDTPDLSGLESESSQTSPNGTQVETFTGEDGIAYERRTRPDGTVEIRYELEGVSYSDSLQEDGNRSVLMSEDTDEALYSRTVEFDTEGKVHSDRALAVQSSIDPETREIGQQTKEIRIDEGGVVTTTERVERPDGGVANFERVEWPSGRAQEVYGYQGEQGEVQRSTTVGLDGTAETHLEKGYTTDQPIEELIDPPPVPGHLTPNILDLPTADREDTEVREVQVTTTTASGQTTLEYEAKTYSQTSGDVQPSEGAFRPPAQADPEGSSITHTYTTVSARDEHGHLQTSNGGSQSFTLAGVENAENFSVTRSDTWNDEGETTETFTQEGFLEGKLMFTSRAGYGEGQEFSGSAGGQYLHATVPDVGYSPFDHLNLKRGGTQEFIRSGHDQPLNVSASVSRGADGQVLQKNVGYSSLDENGDGRTVLRTETEHGVAWRYTEYENNGRDYQRQTVVEGTALSVWQTYETVGPGEFRTTSVTTDGDETIANSQASRTILTEDELRGYVEEGELSQAEFERMVTDGPPYYVEQFSEHAEPLLDGAELKRDDEGNIIQGGHSATSLTLGNGDGYSVSSQKREEVTDEEQWLRSELTTITDLDSTTPIASTITHQQRNPVTGQFEVTDSGVLEVAEDGTVTVDGESVGEFDIGSATVQDLMQGPDGLTSAQLIGAIGGVAQSGDRFFYPGQPHENETVSRAFRVIRHGTDVFGLAVGVHDIFSGFSDGSTRQIIEGVGGVAGGANSLAAATSALTRKTRFAPTVTSLASSPIVKYGGRMLGGAGGAIGGVFGVHDMLTADDGWGRAAGGLNAVAGAVMFGSAFGGPPGWVFGGLIAGGLSVTAVFVGNGGKNDTVSVDDRFD